jgi:spore maturation protein CgeB
LFRPGTDYLVAADGTAMTGHLRALAHDPGLRQELVANGLATIRARHTCAHRVQELLSIVAQLQGARELERVA